MLYDAPHYPVFNIADDGLCMESPICITKSYNLGEFLAYFGFAELLSYKDIIKIRDTYFGNFLYDNCELLGIYETNPRNSGYERYDRFKNHRTFNAVKKESPFSDNYFYMFDETKVKYFSFVPQKQMEPNVLFLDGEIPSSVEEHILQDGRYILILSKSLPSIDDYFCLELCFYGKTFLSIKYTPNCIKTKAKSFKIVSPYPDSIEFAYHENLFEHFLVQKDYRSIICGLKHKNSNWQINGACFEEFDVSIFNELFKNQIMSFNFQDYNPSESIIIYQGFNSSESSNYAHFITITKTFEGLKIKYSVKDCGGDILKLENDFTIPITNVGKITIDELNLLIIELQDKYPNNEFIGIIITELEVFLKRIAIRNNLEEDVYSAISKEALYHKPFNEVTSLIKDNQDYYFGILKEIYEHITSQNLDRHIRELKPKN